MRADGQHDPAERLPVHYALGVRELLLIGWRRKHYVLLCWLIAISLGVAYYLRADHTYEVKARLLVEKQELLLAPGEREKPFKDVEFLATQAEILKSPTVVAEAAKQLDWPVPSPQHSPTTAMIQALTVRPVMGTSVLSVGFQAREGQLAVAGIDAIIENYRRYLSESERSLHVETLEMLTRNERQVREDLHKLEEQYAELRKTSPPGAKGKGGADVHMAMVEQLGRQLAEARSHRIQLENQLQIVSRGQYESEEVAKVSTSHTAEYVGYTIAAPVPKKATATTPFRPAPIPMEPIAAPTADVADIGKIEEQLMEAQLREKDLASRYGDKHPDLRAVRQQVADLQEQHRQALAAAPKKLRDELEAAAANEQQLAAMYQSELNTAKAIDMFLLQDQQMLGQIERVRTLHASIVDQVRHWELTDEAAAEGHSRIKVTLLERPTVPIAPIWPEPLMLLGICSVIGLVSGVSLITFAECRCSSLRPQVAEVPPRDASLLMPAMDHA